MENILSEVASRIREMREIKGISTEEMATAAGVSHGVYLELEKGNSDFTFTFIYKCAAKLGVETTDLLGGESPTLKEYCVNRAGQGMPIARRKGFSYNNIAPLFKGKIAEPFVVKAPFSPDDENAPIKLSRHEGQEFDYILSGSLKVEIDGSVEILNEGDSIYYDSYIQNAMVANGRNCEF